MQAAESSSQSELFNIIPGKNPRYSAYTHFVNFPIQDGVDSLVKLQEIVVQSVGDTEKQFLQARAPQKLHVTVCQLALSSQTQLDTAIQAMKDAQLAIKQLMTSKIAVSTQQIDYFYKNPNYKGKDQSKRNDLTFIYLHVLDNETIFRICDILIRRFILSGLIQPYEKELKNQHIIFDKTNQLFRPLMLHISLFRVNVTKRDADFSNLYKQLQYVDTKEYSIQAIHLSDFRNDNQDGSYVLSHEIKLEQ